MVRQMKGRSFHALYREFPGYPAPHLMDEFIFCFYSGWVHRWQPLNQHFENLKRSER